MNWDAIGAIAEMLGSIAVVITLIVLLIQVRHSASMLKHSTVQSIMNTNNEFLGNLANNPDLYNIYYRGLRNDENLEPQERGRFDLLMLATLRIVDMQFQQYIGGGSDDLHWGAIKAGLQSTLAMPGANASWQRQRSTLSVAFVEEVESWSISPKPRKPSQ